MKIRIAIKMIDKGRLVFDTTHKSIIDAGGLSSGVVYCLQHRVSEIQTRDIYLRPYYRRRTKGITTIFAVQVTPGGV